MDLTTSGLIARLGVAALCGALIGLERETSARGAGARTLALVSLGSALFTVAGAYGFGDIRPDAADPARVAAQVAAGVGFIGAGAIIRHGTSVLGVTTAASVWLAAAVGVMSAAGGYAAAGISTALTLAVLIGLRPLKPWAWRLGRCRSVLRVEYELGHGTLGPLLHALDAANGRLERLVLDDDLDRTRTVTMHVVIPRHTSMRVLVDAVKDRPEVRSLSTAATEQD